MYKTQKLDYNIIFMENIMQKGLFDSLSDWLNSDVVLDCFYSPAFKHEGEYLKRKRKEMIEADLASPKLLVNKTTEEFSLTKPKVLV